MLHHEEHPEKPEDIMTAPISGNLKKLTTPLLWNRVGQEGSNHNQDFVKTFVKLLPFLYKII